MPITGPDILLYEKHDKVVVITLNRPERMNALSYELEQRLEEAWIRFRDDEDAWVAILTGTGEKSFCSGVDLIERNEMAKKGIAKSQTCGERNFGIEPNILHSLISQTLPKTPKLGQ